MHRVAIAFLCALAVAGCRRDAETQHTLTQEQQAEVHGYVAREVAAGYLSESDVISSVVEMFADEIPEPELRRFLRSDTRAEFKAHIEAQKSWPAVTDCDRLDAAFAGLDKVGIVARQNFSCCGTCGVGEIEEEIEEEKSRGTSVRGYAFFHVQDTESAVDGSGLYLNYGSAEDGEEAALFVGRVIKATIVANGLDVVWDGTWEKRIYVKLDWKRRR